MHGEAEELAVRQAGAAVERVGEEDVGELVGSVGVPWDVAALALQIVELDLAVAVRERGDGDDARRGGGEQLREEQPGERKVAEVVGAKLALKAVGRELAGGEGHDAGVVDEDVEGKAAGGEGGGEGADGGEGGHAALGEPR